MNTLELKDKVAVVTGATAFIGRACAIRLAEQCLATVQSLNLLDDRNGAGASVTDPSSGPLDTLGAIVGIGRVLSPLSLVTSPSKMRSRSLGECIPSVGKAISLSDTGLTK